MLAALLAAPSVSAASYAADAPKLRFHEDGKFSIMIFADVQDDQDVEATTVALMNESLDKYKPDLVVYLGDNTVADGYDNQYQAIKTITEPCVTRNVPFAVVFGNHDQQTGVEKEELLKIYQSFGCLTYDDDPAVYGCGNCNLPILSSDGSKTAYNLWFIDSGSSNPDESVGGYDYVREDQIKWYETKAAELKARNGGETVPAVNFQHIVIPEVYNLMYSKIPFGIKRFNYMGKNFFPVPRPFSFKGVVLEPPCPPYVADGQADSWVSVGDIKAAFFGHDHINSYTTNYNGIDITSVPSVGCAAYSNEIVRGAGLITLDENNLDKVDYRVIHMYDMALAEGSTIPAARGAKSKAGYRLMKILNVFLTIFDVFYKDK